MKMTMRKNNDDKIDEWPEKSARKGENKFPKTQTLTRQSLDVFTYLQKFMTFAHFEKPKRTRMPFAVFGAAIKKF